MNTRQFFVQQFESERPKFVSVLRAIPEGKLDYKPHERSSTAGMIGWFLVLELRALVDLVKRGENHWSQPPMPGSVLSVVAEYEKSAHEMERALATIDDERWEREGRMYVGDKVIMKRPVGEIVWDFFFDAIHHRGQLSSYLRPMGGKVPSIYGPSGDVEHA